MDDAGRPVVLIAWMECDSCGRIDKPAHDFNYPADTGSGRRAPVGMAAVQPLRPTGKTTSEAGSEAGALTGADTGLVSRTPSAYAAAYTLTLRPITLRIAARGSRWPMSGRKWLRPPTTLTTRPAASARNPA